jgi:hypothetical protein
MSQSRERGSAAGRWQKWRSLPALVALVLASCGVSSAVVTTTGSDGIYELKCQTSLPRCLEQADTVCRGSRYEVVHATDDRSYRGPLDAFESETRSSSASVRCLARGRSILEGSEHQPAASVTGVAPQSSQADSGPRATAR